MLHFVKRNLNSFHTIDGLNKSLILTLNYDHVLVNLFNQVPLNEYDFSKSKIYNIQSQVRSWFVLRNSSFSRNNGDS